MEAADRAGLPETLDHESCPDITADRLVSGPAPLIVPLLVLKQ